MDQVQIFGKIGSSPKFPKKQNSWQKSKFWGKIKTFAKTGIFAKLWNKILTKIEIWIKRLLSKMEFFDKKSNFLTKNRNFGQKLKLLSKIVFGENFRKNWKKSKIPEKIFFPYFLSPEVNPRLTNKNGVFGQWCVISGTHFSLIFSNELGLTTEKHTKNTSVCGYDNGRSLN